VDSGTKALIFMLGGAAVAGAVWGLRRLLVRNNPTPADADWMTERIPGEGDYGGGHDGHGDGH
jgi:hypothetical protein